MMASGHYTELHRGRLRPPLDLQLHHENGEWGRSVISDWQGTEKLGQGWLWLSFYNKHPDIQEAKWQACGPHGSGPNDVGRCPQQRYIVIEPGSVRALVASHLLDVIELRVLGVGAWRYIVISDQNIKLAPFGGCMDEWHVEGGRGWEDAVSSCQHISPVDCKQIVLWTRLVSQQCCKESGWNGQKQQQKEMRTWVTKKSSGAHPRTEIHLW